MTDEVAVAAALALLRITVGVVMLAHGANHVFGGGRIEGTARWFASLGMRPGAAHAWTASLTELAAGAALVVGLVTPAAAAAVIGTMIVAWVTNHAGNGFFIFRPGEGWEYVMTLTAVAAAIAILGGGTWSLDHLVGIDDDLRGAPGVWFALGGAVAAGLLLLAAWRPDREAADE